MLEVAISGKYHGHLVIVTIGDTVLVFDATPWLDNGLDARLVSDFHTVGKREEGIGGHNGTIEVEPEGMRFGNGLLERINTRGLTTAHTQ